jgi:1-acyl-sn-glycerol-3-phosphate acyltransferase
MIDLTDTRAQPKLGLRVLWRGVQFVLTTIALYVAWLVLMPIAASLKKREPMRRTLLRTWANAMLTIGGGQLTIAGIPPQGPFLLVANHLSYLDIVVLSAATDAVFVAKREVGAWPLFGTIGHMIGTIFIDRRNKRDILRVNALIATELAAGRGVIVFGEGTSSAGATILPLKSPLLEPAVRAGLPVHYVTLHYQTPAGTPPAYLALCWWGAMDFLPHLQLCLGLDSFAVTVRFGATAVGDRCRKRLARTLRAAMLTQFTPSAPVHTLLTIPPVLLKT